MVYIVADSTWISGWVAIGGGLLVWLGWLWFSFVAALLLTCYGLGVIWVFVRFGFDFVCGLWFAFVLCIIWAVSFVFGVCVWFGLG